MKKYDESESEEPSAL